MGYINGQLVADADNGLYYPHFTDEESEVLRLVRGGAGWPDFCSSAPSSASHPSPRSQGDRLMGTITAAQVLGLPLNFRTMWLPKSLTILGLSVHICKDELCGP